MKRQEYAWESDGHGRQCVPVVSTEPTLLDSPKEIVRDIIRLGLIEPVRALIGSLPSRAEEDRLETLREVAIDLSCSRNPALAIDLLAAITGANDYASFSLREYAERHGCSHEWFRQEADQMRKRLGLPG